jgi:pentatricopeptide repeat protein
MNNEFDLNRMEILPATTDTAQDTEHMDASLLEQLDGNFRGVLVSSVAIGSTAWKQGVRPGDVLRSVSGSGNSMWPKVATLESVKVALVSRRVLSGAVTLEFERFAIAANTNVFQLTLTKPFGFQIQETDDGSVQVTAILDSAPKQVKYALQVGDRVVAVDASLGDKLWPVSTVAGVISACTSRLPGQAVTLQFERPTTTSSTTTPVVLEQTNLPDITTQTQTKPTLAVEVSSTIATTTKAPPNHRELLARCRDVLKRYEHKSNSLVPSKLDGVPALVADKVVDALASASVAVDPGTLSLILRAYLSCAQPDDALRVFEAVTGFSADGSLTSVATTVSAKNGTGQLLPNEAALNLYTGTVLLQAHAVRGDLASVERVMAAMEGRSGIVVQNLEVAPWPWTGTYGTIQPDTVCYNVALAAAEKIGGPEALQFALGLFKQMRDPKSKETSQDKRPEKDLVTYNTFLSLLGNEGMSTEVFRLYDKMTRIGLRPDKYTFSALVKSCSQEGDVQELLYEMKERGLQPNGITYNAIIKSLCADRQWSLATKLITEMESKGISPDSMTYGYLMNAMLKGDKPAACLTLFESACANERTVGWTQNVHLYTTAITAAATIGEHERALELLGRMTANGVRPNLKTLTSVVGACLAAKKYALAADVYQKIGEPDGYAMTQGLSAFCGIGDLETAASMLKEQRRGRRKMSGKQMMLSYKVLLRAALVSKDYDLAREMFSDLLQKGYIPSADILSNMIEALEITLRSIVEPDDDDKTRFQFVLFVLDSMGTRNLPIHGNLYSATLVLGRQIGGVQRKIANLLVNAKTTAPGQKLIAGQFPSEKDLKKDVVVGGWERFLQEEDLEKVQMPRFLVRVSPRDVKGVFRAEQSVLYKNKDPKRQTATATQ